MQDSAFLIDHPSLATFVDEQAPLPEPPSRAPHAAVRPRTQAALPPSMVGWEGYVSATMQPVFTVSAESALPVRSPAPSTEPTPERLRLVEEIRTSLRDDDFYPVFQVIVDGRTEQVFGAEALARWQHPTRGFVMPVEFLPAVEAAGLARSFGRRICAQACERLAGWQRAGAMQALVTVNVSPRQLVHPDMPSDIHDALARTGVSPQSLVLEIGESTVAAEPRAAYDAMRLLREIGVRIALDNFGTGALTIGQLDAMPIDFLKIDRAITRMLPSAGVHAAVLRPVVRLAQATGAVLIAEGVEHASQRDALLDAGCHLMQGFFFSQPTVSPDFSAAL